MCHTVLKIGLLGWKLVTGFLVVWCLVGLRWWVSLRLYKLSLFLCFLASLVLVLLFRAFPCFSLLFCVCFFSCFSCFFCTCLALPSSSTAFLYFPASCLLVAYWDCFPVVCILWPQTQLKKTPNKTTYHSVLQNLNHWSHQRISFKHIDTFVNSWSTSTRWKCCILMESCCPGSSALHEDSYFLAGSVEKKKSDAAIRQGYHLHSPLFQACRKYT